MIFIIATIVIVLGIIIFSNTISNIIIITFFAIPFTRKLEKYFLLEGGRIINKYIIIIFVQISLFATVTLLFYTFFDGAFISLVIGYVFGLIAVITESRQLGLNMNNFSDYFETNRNYLTKELISKYEEDREKLLISIISAIRDSK
jgi:hypothetical protein